ncbi:MAG TPA: GlsB/YeaQ/YmgE family stress response membrane protein [Coleofasciculaceae cyanobacterium]
MINIIAWIILGFLAGAIAKAILPGRQGGGIFATTLLGIIGAFVGGTLLHLIQTGNFAIAGAALSISGVIVAVLGAIVFIFIWSLFNKAD